MTSIRARRVTGSLVALLMGSAIVAGCGRAEREAEEQVSVAPETRPPIAEPKPEPAQEQERERASERAEPPTEGIAPSERARKPAPEDVGKDRGVEQERADRADLEDYEGHLGVEVGTAARALQGRMLSGGPGLYDAGQIRVSTDVTEEVVEKPLIPPKTPTTYGFSIYMRTPDLTRRGNPNVRLESVDEPSYSTMPPITFDVSEDTVRPFP